MSWLGKILTFLVLIGACVWAFFTVQAFATRTNWKARADAYEKAFKDSEEARQKEYRQSQADRDALVRLYAAEKSLVDDLTLSVADLSATGRKLNENYNTLDNELKTAKADELIRAARLQTTQDEGEATRKRNIALEDERVRLVLAKEAADRGRLSAENEAKLSRSIADENAKKVETLVALVTELRQSGGSGTAAVLRTIDKVPAPLPANIRGTVARDIVGDLVQISIGIDAGLEPGSRLDVYRLNGGGKYLGTLVVTQSVYPKEAVAVFKPARPVPMAQLRPDELPRKGDLVGHANGPR